MEKIAIMSVTAQNKRSKSDAVNKEISPTQLPIRLSCVIFSCYENEMFVLLSKNEKADSRPAWSLPAEMLTRNENLSSVAEGLVFGLTNQNCLTTELLDVDIQCFYSFEQMLSVTYFSCVMMDGQMNKKLRKHNLTWQKVNRFENLDFDQSLIVKNGLEHLKYNATLRPFGFDFLPEYFTIPQIQKVYETIFSTTFDRRNFSKKMLATSLLIDAGFKTDMTVTNKAKLYKLDKEKYDNDFGHLRNFIHSEERRYSFL